MPYVYIGRNTYFKGKTLWEIVGNLKNYGVGRIVARSIFERYPEPSYMKILKVETLLCPKAETPHDGLRKVRVLVEKTFRGKTAEQPVLIESTSYKEDYKLIPKDEEELYCNRVTKDSKYSKDTKVLPRTMDFPPLLKELIVRDFKAKGENVEEPKLELVYQKVNITRKMYRIAEIGEEPDFKFEMGLGTPASPSLYEGIK